MKCSTNRTFALALALTVGLLCASCSRGITKKEREELAAFHQMMEALEAGAVIQKPDPTNPASELLNGSRKEWLAADDATKRAAIDKIVRTRDPNLSGLDLVYVSAFLVGRMDVIYEQRTVADLAKKLDEIHHSTPK